MDVNVALASLDDTPAKTGKSAPCSRKAKGKQNLESASKKLKRKLKLAYNVTGEAQNPKEKLSR